MATKAEAVLARVDEKLASKPTEIQAAVLRLQELVNAFGVSTDGPIRPLSAFTGPMNEISSQVASINTLINELGLLRNVGTKNLFKYGFRQFGNAAAAPGDGRVRRVR